MRTIRLLSKDDLTAVAEIEKVCFAEPWSEKSLELLLKNGNFGLVAEENGNVVAYVGVMTVLPESEITNVAVLPHFRRSGIASDLLDCMTAELRKRRADCVFLEVRRSNAAARSLYEKKGFSAVGERRNFYSKPVEDAILMNLALQ